MLALVDVADQDLAPARAERVRHAPITGSGERFQRAA